MSKLTWLDWLALVLLVIGGLNWGLYGAVRFDLVAAIFRAAPAISRIIYVLVGLAAIYTIFTLGKLSKK